MRRNFKADAIAYTIGAALGFVLTVFAPNQAHAFELVAERGGESVRFYDTPCQDPRVTKHIRPEMVEWFHGAEVVLGTQYFSACWTPVQGFLNLVYEDGDQGSVPMSDVKDMGV
jgi:hypothetical protein